MASAKSLAKDPDKFPVTAGVGYYYPGDHDHCTCELTIRLSAKQKRAGEALPVEGFSSPRRTTRRAGAEGGLVTDAGGKLHCPSGVASGGQFTGKNAENCAPSPEELAEAVNKFVAGEVTPQEMSPAELDAIAHLDGVPDDKMAEIVAEITGLDAADASFIPGAETGDPEDVLNGKLPGVLDQVEETGGATLSAVGAPVPDDGYVVSNPEFTQNIPKWDTLPPEDQAAILRDYIKANSAELAKPGAYVGMWKDENGRMALDVNDIVADKEEALDLGRERDQKAIWGLAESEEFTTGGTGDTSTSDDLAESIGRGDPDAEAETGDEGQEAPSGLGDGPEGDRGERREDSDGTAGELSPADIVAADDETAEKYDRQFVRELDDQIVKTAAAMDEYQDLRPDRLDLDGTPLTEWETLANEHQAARQKLTDETAALTEMLEGAPLASTTERSLAGVVADGKTMQRMAQRDVEEFEQMAEERGLRDMLVFGEAPIPRDSAFVSSGRDLTGVADDIIGQYEAHFDDPTQPGAPDSAENFMPSVRDMLDGNVFLGSDEYDINDLEQMFTPEQIADKAERTRGDIKGALNEQLEQFPVPEGRDHKYLTDEEYALAEAAVIDHVRDIIENPGELVTRAPVDAIDTIMAGDMMATQFTTRDSSGSFSNARREMVERTQMGVPMLPETRPVYGYMQWEGDHTKQPNSYGDSMLFFNDEVKERTTITMGDSFNDQLAVKVGDTSELSDERILSTIGADWGNYLAEIGGEAVAEARGNSAGWEEFRSATPIQPNYVEAQIHGGVTPSQDVNAVSVPDYGDEFVYEDYERERFARIRAAAERMESVEYVLGSDLGF